MATGKASDPLGVGVDHEGPAGHGQEQPPDAPGGACSRYPLTTDSAGREKHLKEAMAALEVATKGDCKARPAAGPTQTSPLRRSRVREARRGSVGGSGRGDTALV